MRTTTKLVLTTLALGLFVGSAAPTATAAAADPQPVGAMDDCVYVDPFADPPYADVNTDECAAALS